MVGDKVNEAKPSALSPTIYEGQVHYYDRNLLTNKYYLCYQILSQITKNCFGIQQATLY